MTRSLILQCSLIIFFFFNLELKFLEYFSAAILNLFSLFFLCTRVWVTQGWGRRKEGCSALPATPAAPAAPLRLSWAFAALGLSEVNNSARSWCFLPKCHNPEIQEVLPIFHSMSNSGFCLLSWSKALGDCASWPSPAGCLTTFRREGRSQNPQKFLKINKRPPEGLGPRITWVQRAFLDTHNNFLGSAWANPSSSEPHSSARAAAAFAPAFPHKLPP